MLIIMNCCDLSAGYQTVEGNRFPCEGRLKVALINASRCAIGLVRDDRIDVDADVVAYNAISALFDWQRKPEKAL